MSLALNTKTVSGLSVGGDTTWSSSSSGGGVINVTAGDLTIAVLWVDSDVAFTSLKDQAGNDFTLTAHSPASFIAGAGKFWIGYRLSSVGSASSTATGIVATGTVMQVSLIAFTPTGGPVFYDKDVAPANGSTTNVQTPSITPTNANSMCFAFVGTAGAMSSANAPWTLGTIWPSTANADEYDLDVTGAQAVDFTGLAFAWQCMAVAFTQTSSAIQAVGAIEAHVL